MSALPLLFLDVDGPLIPFGGGPYRTYPPATPEDAHPLLGRIDPAHGPRLRALPCELVWATTWGQDANTTVAPRLGLPPLPVAAWPDDPDENTALHWKTRALVARAAGRPFVWVDDEIRPPDVAWVTDHHPAPALLHRVDPRRGLAQADYRAVAAWLHALPNP
ncbi:HAD domain-containing protein [Actinocorallia sp. A-T 12471]|uniref:HAD domain-containing protein n=1 Tax=Actinocorallia sp. A-T 12471 TaxID=3089813 RepID=UPI0029CE467E|nr:HAD domain-containing protein [Actinocorallia sp. A-T 12471]MDX6744758.1 hypothetical protein [Actinocorallia sp. A-T 12471]